jgi:hypothetical protein
MTSSVTQLPAANNGTEPTADASRAKREHGMCRVQEQLVYHVTGLAESALYEAEQLTHALNRAASQRTLDHDGGKGTEPPDMQHVAAVIAEALDCIDVAAEQLSRLSTDIRTRLEPAGF